MAPVLGVASRLVCDALQVLGCGMIHRDVMVNGGVGGKHERDPAEGEASVAPATGPLETGALDEVGTGAGRG